MNILELRGINHFRLAVLKKYAYFKCILDKKMEEGCVCQGQAITEKRIFH